MRRRLLATSSLTCLMLLIMANTAFAQSLRPVRTFYLYPKIGITQYTGDRDLDLTALWDNRDSNEYMPFGGGLEIGYQLTSRFSLGGEGAIGFYPTATDPTEDGTDVNSPVAYSGKLIGRWTVKATTASLAPFWEAGLFGITAVEDSPGEGFGSAFGPLLGVGLDWNLAPQLSLMFELQNMLAIPDDGFDGDDTQPEDENTFQRFDFLNQLSVGLKYSFKRPVTPPVISALNCPTMLIVGEAGTFTAAVNPDVTEPVEYRWEFGGAGMGTGLTATQTFTRPGNYTVMFTAMNEGGEATRTCVVNVEPAPIAAAILTLTANPQQFEVCAPVTVTFNANVEGDEPLTYEWNFGDGETGTGEVVTHTYTEPGTYTATLNLSNEVGAVDRAITIEALACAALACEEITELNSVYFPRNSSVLTDEGRAALQENLEILREIESLCARLEGYAAPGERNPQELSEARARAVADFFEDAGIAASRFTVVGMGQVGGTTTKKEGGAQYQRADVIPVCCDDM